MHPCLRKKNLTIDGRESNVTAHLMAIAQRTYPSNLNDPIVLGFPRLTVNQLSKQCHLANQMNIQKNTKHRPQNLYQRCIKQRSIQTSVRQTYKS